MRLIPSHAPARLVPGALAFIALASLANAQQPAEAPAPLPPATAVAPAVVPSGGLLSETAAAEPMVSQILMRDESLSQVLDLVERWTGRTILRPQSLPATTYTLTLPKQVTKGEALQAIETLLNMNGVALTPMGDRFIKATALNLVRSEAPELIEGSTLNLPPSGRIAAKLYQLDFLRVTEFVPQASTLLNQALGAAPVVFEKANAVLITDSVANLQRIETLIQQLDRPILAGVASKSYTLQFAKASDVVNKLRTLLSGPLAAQIGTTTTYQADDRTNKVILISDARQQAFFDNLVAQLDVSADPNTRTDVIKLNNAEATEVATLLSQLVTGQTAAARTAGQDPNSRLTNNRAANNNANPAPPAPGANAAATLVQNAAATETFSSLLTILADERSNAIVVSGTADDIRLLKELVAKIDVLLAQVRIEVVIAEVTLSNEATSGVDSLGLRVENNKLTGFLASGPGAAIGGIGTDGASGFADSSGYGQNLSAVIGLSTTPRKNNTTILSVPTIVTSHNKEAEIFVGETRPVISGTTSAASGSTSGLTTSSTVTQQEIGIRLMVTPLIGPDGSVQLEIEQEVEDVLGTVIIDGNEQPRIGRRTTTSFVSAANGDIIVLGGLQRNSNSKTSSRLGPIPLLGDLFGRRSRNNTRTDLVFFLRPVVLTNNTALDNAEVIERLEKNPQGKAIKAVIEARPAAAPALPAASDDASAEPQADQP
ncbi:MAG: secretin N-terminal domain-containing protein [Verrucomicrobiota bacterium]